MSALDFGLDKINKALAEKEISAGELFDQCLGRIKSAVKLNCFIRTFENRSYRAAQDAQQKELQKSELAIPGVPVALKDVFLVQDTITTAGSKILENFKAPFTATAVNKLYAAGAVIVGKTNLDEFAMGSSNENSYFGPVLNPWNHDCVPGGSSGGSAAAVASRLVPVALGTDTGGSIRQPASFCGVTGVRPTYGRVSRYGVVAYASSLDQVGVFARYVEDAARILEIIAGHDPHDATSSKRPVPNFRADLQDSVVGLRIGVPRQYFEQGLADAVASSVHTALKLLESQGAKLIEIDLPNTAYAVPVYYIIATAEASSNLGRYDGIRFGYRNPEAKNLMDLYSRSRSIGFGQETKRRILLGTYVLSRGYYDRYYRKARLVQSLIAADFHQAFAEKCDVIAGPTAPTTAFRLGEKIADPLQMYMSDILTVPANLAGLPSLNVPCGFDSQGLPVGLQLIGQKWEEQKILNTAWAYQKSTDWHERVPPGVTKG